MSDTGRILLLDDDPLVPRTVGALVAAETAWTLDGFHEPAAAIAALESRPFDAVVSDYLMPEMDGIKFLERARELQPRATRILLTGYADKQNAIRSINSVRLYHYVEKPWDNDELLLVLRNALERAQLLQRADEALARLAARDRDLEALRQRLLKAIL